MNLPPISVFLQSIQHSGAGSDSESEVFDSSDDEIDFSEDEIDKQRPSTPSPITYPISESETSSTTSRSLVAAYRAQIAATQNSDKNRQFLTAKG